MKLIVGLGNPGKKYDNTRHNIGFMCVDTWLKQNSTTFSLNKKFEAEMAELNINNDKVIVIKPQTFMNLSGSSVSKVLNYYNIDLDDLIVIQDDLDLEFGKIRLKFNSSSGGQNGIKDIIKHLHSQEFLRIKVGIKNQFKHDAANFVIANFNQDEKQQLEQIIAQVCAILDDFSRGEVRSDLMNKYN